MTCVPGNPTFRLLDALVGWDPASVEHLAGLDALSGITLEPLSTHEDGSAIAHALPPARIARGCGPCEWLLVTCCPPASRLLRLDPCADGWRQLGRDCCSPSLLVCATAIALHCDRIAISDPGAQRVWMLRDSGRALAFDIPMATPGPIAWRSGGTIDGRSLGEWLVADLDALRLRRFDPDGGERPGALPLPGRADRIGIDEECRIWLVTRDQGFYRIWRAELDARRFLPATLAELLASLPDTGLRQYPDHTFCIEDTVAGAPRRRCFDCYGRPATPMSEPPTPLYKKQGQLLTLAIDSRMPRCRWHRVRIDADVPAGTSLAVAVSSNEDEKPADQGVDQPGPWQGFQHGLPHPADWQEGVHGALDLAIDQPPGRYLFLRLRLMGDGIATPVVRRIRVDFPRQTSLDRLPAVYRDNPVSEDFSERFLALFDAAVEDIDRAIERNPALLDVDGVPPDVLPWLGGFLDVAMDPAWTVGLRRAVLKAVPDLYPRRGTPSGFRDTLKLLLGVEPAIEESGLSRPWGAVGRARIDGVRLYGRSRSRFRLGRSPLSGAPVWSVGDPALDPIAGQAFRFRVTLPAGIDTALADQAGRIVESQKPAHTVAALRQGGFGIVVGQGIQVGVDTALVPLPPPVLGGTGGSAVRLGRSTVLRSRSCCSGAGIAVGRGSAVGIHTLME
ncbi:MAG TPA: phage tail protein [Candidatus Cybelea sp.]|nr:phage tail protein [Candidatus Cybelea sp.]